MNLFSLGVERLYEDDPVIRVCQLNGGLVPFEIKDEFFR